MLIKELEVENFKSFRHQKFVFNKGITAITGPNGAGKSNIFDALLFVLGCNSSLKLRYKKISDLICREQKEKYATVRLTFDDGTTIERSITEDCSVFRLNGKRTTQEAIVSFLKELKISPEGHNLVQQGDNKKIVDINDTERKKLVEDIAEVSLFDEQREKSEKNLEFVRQKLAQAKVIMEERQKIMEDLEKEKGVAEDYLRIKEQETILKGVILKKEKQNIEYDIARTQTKIELLDRMIPSTKSRVRELEKEIKKINVELADEKGKYKKQQELSFELDTEQNILQYQQTLIKETIQTLKNQEANKKKRLAEIDTICSKNQSLDLKTIERELQELKLELDRYNVKKLEHENLKSKKLLEKIDKKILKKYSELHELKSKLFVQNQKELENKKVLEKLHTLDSKIKKLHKLAKAIKKRESELGTILSQKEELKSIIENANKEILNSQEKMLQSKYKLDVNKKEISIIKAAAVNNKIIIVESEKEADEIINENIKNDIFGTFFFVLAKDYDVVKPKIIIKTANPDAKIKSLEEENLILSTTIDSLEKSLDAVRLNLQEYYIKQKNIESKYDLVVREINNLKNIEDQILYLQKQREELASTLSECDEQVSQEDVDKLNKEIEMLIKEKQTIVPVDFEKYLELSQKYTLKQEEYNTRKIELELLTKEKTDINLELHTLEKQIKEENKKLGDLIKKFSELDAKKETIKKTLRDLELNIEKFEAQVKNLEQEKVDVSMKISLYEQQQQEMKNNLFLKEDMLTKKIEEIKKFVELNPNVDPGKLEEEFKKNQGIAIKDLQNVYYDLLNELNQFGSVNLKSIEDYAEYCKKYKTILDRIDQLEKEMQEIKDKIKEIQIEKEQKFLMTYDLINKNFGEILTKLGLGDLYLEIERNELDEISGVSIKSTKRGAISLSGGEKALVTIAFLFSVLLLEPSSFYLLDEIDSDLDYNNSEIVFNMLKEFAKNTQILMITHNPVIVNKVDNVIGVSKKEHGTTTIFVKQ